MKKRMSEKRAIHLEKKLAETEAKCTAEEKSRRLADNMVIELQEQLEDVQSKKEKYRETANKAVKRRKVDVNDARDMLEHTESTVSHLVQMQDDQSRRTLKVHAELAAVVTGAENALIAISAKYQLEAVVHHKGDLLQGDGARAAGVFSNPIAEVMQDIGHLSNGDMICESILGAHDNIRRGRHIIDPYKAEARTLAQKNGLIEELYQLSDEERWLRIELAGEFKKDFRGKVGNMIKQRTGRYRWGMQGKVEKRAKRKVRTAHARSSKGTR
jgi:hypothetical protein